MLLDRILKCSCHNYKHILYYACAGYTLALWLKIETECSQPIAIVYTESREALVYQSGVLQFHFRKSNEKWRVVAEGVVVGRWHHVTVTWSTSSGHSLYIDAIPAGRCDVLLSPSPSLSKR